ncbi:MAG: hypothetical protein Q9176_006404 [Flavoplaca citrina]
MAASKRRRQHNGEVISLQKEKTGILDRLAVMEAENGNSDDEGGYEDVKDTEDEEDFDDKEVYDYTDRNEE